MMAVSGVCCMMAKATSSGAKRLSSRTGFVICSSFFDDHNIKKLLSYCDI